MCGKEKRNAVLKELLSVLWIGNVDEALAYLKTLPPVRLLCSISFFIWMTTAQVDIFYLLSSLPPLLHAVLLLSGNCRQV